MSRSSWQLFPAELKMAVADTLDNIIDIRALTTVDLMTHNACIPALFRNVTIRNYRQLEEFLDNVPHDYYRCIRQLELCNEDCTVSELELAKSIVSVLVAASFAEELTVRTAGALHHSIIPYFTRMLELRILIIAFCGDQEKNPLSERIVVSIAASIPNLQHLSLDRISRSTLHAPELVGAYPYISLVSGDNNIPAHPLLGQDLSLPSLLRISSLRKLIIRDTHLGDPKWQTVLILCQLQVLDLGSCFQESEDTNRLCTERIMSAVGPTISEVSLTTGLSLAIPLLPRLRNLHISPFVPIDSIVDTISSLSDSPIETLSIQCYDDDAEDAYAALEDFLSLRTTRGTEFYAKLQRLDVTITNAIGIIPISPAAKRLQNHCRELRLASRLRAEATPLDVSKSENMRSMDLFADVNWVPLTDHGRIRAMTI